MRRLEKDNGVYLTIGGNGFWTFPDFCKDQKQIWSQKRQWLREIARITNDILKTYLILETTMATPTGQPPGQQQPIYGVTFLYIGTSVIPLHAGILFPLPLNSGSWELKGEIIGLEIKSYSNQNVWWTQYKKCFAKFSVLGGKLESK